MSNKIINHLCLSVVMCTYNGARFLKEQLDSILNQSRLPDEMIICDDGSLDTTLEILNEYAKKAKFSISIFFNTKNLGACKNFEQAIFRSSGNIIILSDQDDIWSQDKLQIIEKIFYDNPLAGYVFSDGILINDKGEEISSSLWERAGFSKDKQAVFPRGSNERELILIRKNVVTGATMAFRSEIRQMVLPVPDLWMHDEWIAYISSLKNIQAVKINEPLIRYRIHQAQAAGLRENNFFKRIWNFLIGAPEAYENELNKWRAAYELLKTDTFPDLRPLNLIEAKVNHLVFRTNIHKKPRYMRVKAILHELNNGWYDFFYSEGWKGALKDFLIAQKKDGG